MGMYDRVRVGFVFALAVLVQPVLAHAIVLQPGPNAVIPVGTTLALRPELAGIVLEDVMRPFQVLDEFGAPFATGNIQERVIQADSTGKLIFDASIHIDWAAPGVAWDFLGRRYMGSFQSDVDWRLDGLGTVFPSRAWRAVPDEVWFTPWPYVPQSSGQTRFMFIATDASYYAESANVLQLDFILQDVIHGAWAPGFYPVSESPNPACSDLVDDDHDGLADYPDDPGCSSPTDTSEDDASLPCDDGVDNDGDGYIDYRVDVHADPGCFNATYSTESPACQDGIDNDSDTGIDFDGGVSVNGGIPLDPPDAQCNKPYQNSEKPRGKCGLGTELVFALPVLMAMARRNARRRAASE
jgi:hypothetical protein